MMKKGIIFLIICLIVSLFLTATGCESSINGSQNEQLLDFYPLHDGLEYGVMVGKAKYLSQIVIPETYLGLPVTTILSKGFSDCNDLRSIIIPGSVTSIGSSAFSYCSSLTSITIPDNVTSIGSYAFSDCSSLTSVTIGDSVTSISDYAFYNCSSLTSITIPDSVTSIGWSAFNGCSSLTSITIPNSVTSIGSYAFRDCSSLTIYAQATSKPSGWDSDWNYSNCPVVWNYQG